MDQPRFDIEEAHGYFAEGCSKETWGLLEKPGLSASQRDQMIDACHASLYHLAQRSDCTPLELSIGCWLLSRVYAVCGQMSAGLHYGQLSLEHAQAACAEPFYLAYAYEALARAAALGEPASLVQRYLAQASEYADEIENAERRRKLQDDLRSIEFARA